MRDATGLVSLAATPPEPVEAAPAAPLPAPTALPVPAREAARSAVAQHLHTLPQAAWAYDYFALMRRLEAVAAPAPRWGHALLPGAEAVRIGQEPSLAFAPASLSRWEPASAHAPARLRQHFFGYLGPNGPLPVHWSDFVRERSINHGDATWLSFLDGFTHRFSLYFYRAWAQARPAVELDRPDEDGFRRRVGALIGVGTAARQQRDEIPDDARLHFAGWLSRRVHGAEGVQRVLAAYFGVPVRLEPWVGHWMPIRGADLTRLGRGGAACQLGSGAMLGRRAWDRQHRVRLHVGPLSLAQYRDFLPIGQARPVLSRWMQQLLGDEMFWDAQLQLRRAEVPPTRLGGAPGADGVPGGNAPLLGWTSWLGARPRAHDAADVRIGPVAHAPAATPWENRHE